MTKTEKSIKTVETKTEKPPVTEKTKNIDETTTAHTSQNSSGNIPVFDKLYLFQNFIQNYNTTN